MKYKIGDRVKFLNEVGGGTVKAIGENYIVVEDEHGFEWEMAENDLVTYQPHLESKYDVDISSDLDFIMDLPQSFKEAKEDEILQFVTAHGKKTYLEIDLHINELVDRTSHLSNHQMVTIQLDHFKRLLRLAKKEKYQKIVVIHGVGEGVLRAEIRQILSKIENCSYHDADFERYGNGATEVRLWYN